MTETNTYRPARAETKTYESLLLQAHAKLAHVMAHPPRDAIETAAVHILDMPGTVTTTGIGKSGIAARKFAVSLSTIGIAAQYLHPADALHGELGVIQDEAPVVAFSASGSTKELVQLALAIEDYRRSTTRGAVNRPSFDVGFYGDPGSLKVWTETVVPTYCTADCDAISHHVPSVSFMLQNILADAVLVELADIGHLVHARTHPAGAVGRLTQGVPT